MTSATGSRCSSARASSSRISAEVDPHLEITEIVDRTVKSGGPALLFERPKGSEHPLLINQFGTERRMCLAFGVESLDDVGKKLQDVLELQPPEGLREKVSGLLKLKEIAGSRPKEVRSGPCQGRPTEPVEDTYCCEPPAPWRGRRQLAEQPQQYGEEKKIEYTLLDETVEKNPGTITGKNQTRGNSSPPRKQIPAGCENQRAGNRSQSDLDQSNQPEIMPKNGLEKPEEVGIERRLIENSLPQPVAGSDFLAPLIVCPAVAGEVIKKRDRIDLNQVEQPHQKRAGENDPEPAGIRQRRKFALRLDGGSPLLCPRSLFSSRRHLTHRVVSAEPAAFCCALRILSAS